MKRFPLFFTMIMLPFCLLGQEGTINFKNPSFEGMPQHSTPPSDWEDCNFLHESPASTLPGFFEVTKKAIDGKTYVGMSVRDNGTWESVFQVLENPLQKGKCYGFDIHLAKGGEGFESISRNTSRTTKFKGDVGLRVWGT